ncbi:hypothetical protein [Pseudonocardia sp. HH130630-07]|uniref:hypothetical protein n=1 Tax=Pseudonocardia sp. HH130630-07 TaxID=1690815 RepID=UPI000814F88A|nr:hypothetical protein [Pseudonocardia sp. HH130630-07]ANY08697.1 hypothetical protein AFB00_23255 [Pseudonocardia sp. HH130630-07]
MTAEPRTPADRAAAAETLRRVRERRGWSWADLARALRATAQEIGLPAPAGGSVAGIQRTIARWESRSRPNGPAERYRRLLVHTYLRTPGGRPDIGAGSDCAQVLDALRGFGASEAQLAELLGSTARDGVIAGAPARGERSGRADPAMVEALHHDVALLDEQVGVVPFVRLQVELAPLLRDCRSSTATDGSTGAINLVVTAEALAARLAFENGDDRSATSHYAGAAAAAARLDDRWRRARVLTSRAMTVLHAHDDPDVALPIARAAVVDAHAGSRGTVRARAHAVHAEVQSRCGSVRDAEAALDRA